MKKIAVKMTLTKGLVFEGVSDYIGNATMCIDVAKVDVVAIEKLYELNATVRALSDSWEIQISKQHIEKIEFLAVN
jgi:hypothetical protein